MPESIPATQDEIHEELHRVQASRQFVDSPRLSRLLAFVVKKALAADTGEIAGIPRPEIYLESAKRPSVAGRMLSEILSS